MGGGFAGVAQGGMGGGGEKAKNDNAGKRGEVPTVDGAKWGMPGVMCPKPGVELTKGPGRLLDSAIPTVVFKGACATCGKQGHKAIDCPPDVYQCGAVKKASMRYMFQKGHYNADGTDKKP